MDFIKKVISKDDCTLAELINCFECIKNNGDVVVIKFDGERIENEYTVFISFPIYKKREMIRADESELNGALIKVLREYIR